MREVEIIDGEVDVEALVANQQPVLLKKYIANWPVVEAARISDGKVMDYLSSFANEHPVVVYELEPESEGRFFYTEDFKDLNFKSSRKPLVNVIETLKASVGLALPKTYYVGSTTIDKYLPGFRLENDLALQMNDPMVSIWLGNQSTVAAHFDAPNNIACCIAGARTFTLFPPDQIENLYIGPLDKTPSGQAISLVDFKKPDFNKFPKFEKALKQAQTANLEPGDALFLPSMWWHHVESKGSFNGLVNYWWRDVPSFKGPGVEALKHAMLNIRDLPDVERQAWRAMFEHYVFSEQANKFDYMPEDARESLGALDSIKARRLRAWLLNKLNR